MILIQTLLQHRPSKTKIDVETVYTTDTSIEPSPLKKPKKKLKLKNYEKFICKYIIKKGQKKAFNVKS